MISNKNKLIKKKLITLLNSSKTKNIMINKIIDKSNVMSKIEDKTFENLKRLILKLKLYVQNVR